MPRQRGSELDIANVICSRTNRVIDFVSQHRVRLLMQGLSVGLPTHVSLVLLVAHHALRMACGRLPGFTPLKTTQGATKAAVKNRIVCGLLKVSRAPLSSTVYCSTSRCVAKGSEFSLRDYRTRFLLLLTCEGPTLASPELQRTSV